MLVLKWKVIAVVNQALYLCLLEAHEMLSWCWLGRRGLTGKISGRLELRIENEAKTTKLSRFGSLVDGKM